MTVAASVEAIRAFVIEALDEPLRAQGLDPAQVGDDLDLLTAGVIDSLGVLELLTDVEEPFGLVVDYEEIDPEGLTMLGPLCRYIATEGAPA